MMKSKENPLHCILLLICFALQFCIYVRRTFENMKRICVKILTQMNFCAEMYN